MFNFLVILCFVWTGVSLPFFLFCVILGSIGRYQREKALNRIKEMELSRNSEDY